MTEVRQPRRTLTRFCMQKVLVLVSAVCVFCVVTLPSALAQSHCGPGPDNSLPICSYTATNGSCRVTISRVNPVTPPSIYVKRGCSVTVSVSDPSPLEDL